MFLLLALSVSAQPFTGRLYAQPGMYVPGPQVLARQDLPQRSFGGVPTQAQFDVMIADEDVRADRIRQRADNMVYNAPWATMFPGTLVSPVEQSLFLKFGSMSKAEANRVSQQIVEDKIDYFYATHRGPLSAKDRATLDDLELELQVAQNQVSRRTAEAFPSGLNSVYSIPLNSFFARKAHESGLQLAENSLSDARSDYREKPDRENHIDLTNAEDNAEQAKQKRDADTIGIIGGLSKIPQAPIYANMLLKKASASQVGVGERKLREARLAYAKDPSQDNRDAVRLASLFLRASETDDSAISKDLLSATLLSSSTFKDISTSAGFLAASQNADQAKLWLKYSRVKRAMLERQLAETKAKEQTLSAPPTTTNTVEQRMLAMSMYGRVPYGAALAAAPLYPATPAAAPLYPSAMAPIYGGRPVVMGQPL